VPESQHPHHAHDTVGTPAGTGTEAPARPAQTGRETVEFWEQRYAGASPVWSGRANDSLVAATARLAPGRALDLGCGEGGDSLWLASQGWSVTGIDISPTAIDRARAAADKADVRRADVRWVVADLEEWLDAETAAITDAATDAVGADGTSTTGLPPGGGYDLVSACFFQSPVRLDRTGVLRGAAALLQRGGHLLVVSHAAPPPWSNLAAGHDHLFLSPDQELDALGLPTSQWQVVTAEVRRRAATAPDGSAATLDDSVVLLRRR